MILRYFLPFFSTTLLYVICYFISVIRFHVEIESFVSDYIAQLILAYLTYALSRKRWTFITLQLFLMSFLYIGNAVKIAFFGGPMMPDDVFSVRSLLLILESWQFFAAVIPLVTILCLSFFNFSLKNWKSYTSAILCVSLLMTIYFRPALIVDYVDKNVGTKEWDQRSNYLWQGATLYAITEISRYFLFADSVPDIGQAQKAARFLLASQHKTPVNNDNFTPRNVHIVLLESFWDENSLKKVQFSENPLDNNFRQLWKAANYSHGLTPVFAGMTANSEFEILCGFPVTKNTVKFERQLLNEVPCLPRLLADKGYKTVVSHPNVPIFWNRVNAYHRVGFQTYWSEKDFVLDDINREFLGDSSLYRQVLDKISDDLDKKTPIVDYIVTYFGHWDYPLNENRPPRIKTNSRVPEVTSYANTLYYKSHELMAFLNVLKQKDPHGIIVLFGDHLPFLGDNFAGYVESEKLAKSRSDFSDDMFKFYVSTPLLVIDGEKGALNLGDLPLYQVPKLILNLLNYHEPTIFDYTIPPENMRIRPIVGLHFALENGNLDVCKQLPYSQNCQVSADWLKAVNEVSNDLFIGKQFSRIIYD